MKTTLFTFLAILPLLVACKDKESPPSAAATGTSKSTSAPTTSATTSATSTAQTWSPEKLAKKKRSVEGTVTLEGKTLRIKDAVAQWKPDKRELAIEMLPYELDAPNFVKACTKSVFFTDRPKAVAPWEWVPESTIFVTFREDAKAFDLSTLKALRLNAYHMRKKNETVFIHRKTEHHGTELTKLSGMSGPGSMVEFVFKGDDTEKKASWDLKGRVPVCVKAK